MDFVAILDTETSALTPEEGECIEVALVRYSVKHACVVDSFSRVMQSGENAAERINHIPASLLKQYGYAHDTIWRWLDAACAPCEAVLAHNADFDRQWVPESNLLRKPWIDPCRMVDWPKQSKPGSSLINLALEHGLGVVDPHRALSDCLMLARLMTRCAELGHDLEAILARGLRPAAMFEALVPIQRKDEAKDLGFGWMNAGYERKWTRKMAIEDTKSLPFDVRQL